MGHDDDDEEDDGKYDDICECVNVLQKDALLSPVEIINILAKHPTLPLSVAFDFIKHTQRNLDEEISTLESSVEGMREVIATVQSTPTSVSRRSQDRKEDDDDDVVMRERREEKKKWEAIKKAQIGRSDNH